jgi:uncharacterized membrane protein YkgB
VNKILYKEVSTFDHAVIHFFRKISVPTARISLFIVFFWFGLLKVVGLSPAGALVHDLYNQTIPFVDFNMFYMAFALFECLIGILFLIPKATRIVIPLLLVHMITTLMPLVFLPAATWNGFLVPTMAGQYIIKNLIIIAAAVGIAAHMDPIPRRQ